MDVFVLGYPLGKGFSALPVWKRGSIASEPAIIADQQRFVLIDSASRPGMSGSPVIRRSWGIHTMTNGGHIGGVGHATRFVGVYAGRVGPDDQDVQLGLMWPAKFVEEIIAGGVRDDAP
jgi:hypothetical protein